MRAVLGCAAVLALSAGLSLAGQAKLDAKKLAGKWEPAPEEEKKKDKKDKKEEKPPPGPAMVIEFTPDPKAPAEGKVLVTATEAGKENKAGGTYKLDGDKLSVTLKLGDKEEKQTMTVKSLTDTEFVTQDSKDKVETFRRKK